LIGPALLAASPSGPSRAASLFLLAAELTTPADGHHHRRLATL
jgi:hypothetical protein